MNVEQITNNAAKCQALINGTMSYNEELYGIAASVKGVDTFYAAVRMNPELVSRWPELAPQLAHEDAFYSAIPTLEMAAAIGALAGKVSMDMAREALASGQPLETRASVLMDRIATITPPELEWSLGYMRTQSEIYDSIPVDVMTAYLTLMSEYITPVE